MSDNSSQPGNSSNEFKNTTYYNYIQTHAQMLLVV